MEAEQVGITQPEMGDHRHDHSGGCSLLAALSYMVIHLSCHRNAPGSAVRAPCACWVS